MMMKYEKGSGVEVLKSKESARECWRTGEVIGGNGSFYIVRFDGYACCGGSPLVQAVQPGSVRPCPPVVKVFKLRHGDVVEVLVDFGWRTATVSKVVRNGYVWVTLEDFEKIRVRKGDFRVKQAWLNDEWVVVKKSSLACGKKTSTNNLMCKSEIMQTEAQNSMRHLDDSAAAKKIKNRTHQVQQKRKSLCGSNPEPFCEVKQKSRAIERDGLVVRAPAVTQPPTAADPGTRYLSSKTQKQSQTCSFWSKLWFSRVNVVKETPFDTDTTMSSIGSCSINDHGACVLHYHTLGPKCSQKYKDYVSDAESFFAPSSEENNNIQPAGNVVLAKLQRCKSIRSFMRRWDLFLRLILVFAACALLR